jgi:hypothetical protein
MGMSGGVHAWPIYSQGKSPWYPLDRRLGGPQSRSGLCGEEKNSQPLSRLEPPVIHSVAQLYTTELSRVISYELSGSIKGGKFLDQLSSIMTLLHGDRKRAIHFRDRNSDSQSLSPLITHTNTSICLDVMAIFFNWYFHQPLQRLFGKVKVR